MAGLFMTWKNIDREKYGKIFENPATFSRSCFSLQLLLHEHFRDFNIFQRISEKFWTSFISIKIVGNSNQHAI